MAPLYTARDYADQLHTDLAHQLCTFDGASMHLTALPTFNSSLLRSLRLPLCYPQDIWTLFANSSFPNLEDLQICLSTNEADVTRLISRVATATGELRSFSCIFHVMQDDEMPAVMSAVKSVVNSNPHLRIFDFCTQEDMSEDGAYPPEEPLALEWLGHAIGVESSLFEAGLSPSKMQRALSASLGVSLAQFRILGRSLWHYYLHDQSAKDLTPAFSKIAKTFFELCFPDCDPSSPSRQDSILSKVVAHELFISIVSLEHPVPFLRHLGKTFNVALAQVDIQAFPSRPIVRACACMLFTLTLPHATSVVPYLKNLLTVACPESPGNFLFVCIEDLMADQLAVIDFVVELFEDENWDSKLDILDSTDQGAIIACLLPVEVACVFFEAHKFNPLRRNPLDKGVFSLCHFYFDTRWTVENQASVKLILENLAELSACYRIKRPSADYLPLGMASVLLASSALLKLHTSVFPDWEAVVEQSSVHKVLAAELEPQELLKLVEAFCQAATGKQDLPKPTQEALRQAVWRWFLDEGSKTLPKQGIKVVECFGVPKSILEEIKIGDRSSVAYNVLVEMKVIRLPVPPMAVRIT